MFGLLFFGKIATYRFGSRSVYRAWFFFCFFKSPHHHYSSTLIKYMCVCVFCFPDEFLSRISKGSFNRKSTFLYIFIYFVYCLLSVGKCGVGERIFSRANGFFSFFNLGAKFVLCQRVRARDRQRRRAGETSGGAHVLRIGERPASPILKSMVVAVSRREGGEKGFPFSRTRPRRENPSTSNRRTHVAHSGRPWQTPSLLETASRDPRKLFV